MPCHLRRLPGGRRRFAGRVMLRLPHAVAPLFENWLTQHFPRRKEKILGRLPRHPRGGKLYRSDLASA